MSGIVCDIVLGQLRSLKRIKYFESANQSDPNFIKELKYENILNPELPELKNLARL